MCKMPKHAGEEQQCFLVCSRVTVWEGCPCPAETSAPPSISWQYLAAFSIHMLLLRCLIPFVVDTYYNVAARDSHASTDAPCSCMHAWALRILLIQVGHVNLCMLLQLPVG